MVLTALGVASINQAVSGQELLGPVGFVSRSPGPSDKARLVVVDSVAAGRPTLVVIYLDGEPDAADVLSRRSVDDGATWSEAANLSGTPGRADALGRPGSADKASVVNRGESLLAAWTDTHCPGGAQGSHDNDGDGRPTAYSCVRVARSADAGATWTPPERLTDGSRDASNIVASASDAGFALAWQEDPRGLQPGEAEGPGDGGSGAKTSPGTDIHYSALSRAAFGAGAAFPTPVRLSDNAGDSQDAPAASRAALTLVGNVAVVAYEESKGSGGKNIIWHTFPWLSPPTNAPGDILNDPSEHARRVRIVAQGTSQRGPSKTAAIVLWRQGAEVMCGPADIVVRTAADGLTIDRFRPPLNLTSPGLHDSTAAIPGDSARAHRALLRGDFIAAVYNYTPDDAAVARQEANYNTFIRISRDGGGTWDAARNLSNITDLTVNSGEPRLLGTPNSVPGGLPEEQRDPNALFVAWGTHTNDPDCGGQPLDLFLRVSRDQGASFGGTLALADGPGAQSEVQVRASGDGRLVQAVWLDTAPGNLDVAFRGIEADLDGDTLPDRWELRYGLDPTTALGPHGASGDADNDGLSNAAELAVGGHPRGSVTRYLPEGAVGDFFDLELAVVNAGSTTASTALRYLGRDGRARAEYLPIPPQSRRTIRPRALLGIGNHEYSTVVEADQSVTVERTMRWPRGNAIGAHASTALAAASTTWFLAEGATGGPFNLFYLLENPGAAPASVRVTYVRPAPKPPLSRLYEVPAFSRHTIWVETEDAALVSEEVAAIIESTNGMPIVVERAMYLSRPGEFFAGGTAGPALPTVETRSILAEGATGSFFDTFVTFLNPGTTDANLRLTYLLPDGSTTTQGLIARAQSRETLWVDVQGPAQVRDAAFSMAIESTNGVPVAVERTMWWPGPTAATWSEGHVGAPSATTGRRWVLADGEVGGVAGGGPQDTYVLVANVLPASVDVRATLLFDDGGPAASRTFTAPGSSRFTIDVGREFPEAAGRRFAAVIDSGGDVVVERATYHSTDRIQWRAGVCTLGDRIP